MADDLPEISQDFNTPLPQVDPNSALVPYRMSRTDPSGQEVVTTGYGPRARPPIQPPAGFGGGVGMPDLDRIYQAAFSKLPVDQAVKAVEAASRYLGQRGYQRDLAAGTDATQAFAKWAPMMFHQATGIPEAFQAQLQRAKMNAPTIHGAGGGLYRVPATGPAETLVAPKPPVPAKPTFHYNNQTGEVLQVNPDGTTKVVREGKPKKEPPTQDEKDAWKELDEARKFRDDLLKKPPTSPNKKAMTAYQKSLTDANMRLGDARARVARFGAALPDEGQPKNPAISSQDFGIGDTSKAAPAPTPQPKEVVKTLKNGRKAVFDPDTKKFLRYADGQ